MLRRLQLPRAPSERRVGLRRYAAAAAVVGGTAWAVKAGLTLATGDEPPAAFMIGLALFPFALLGLWSVVRTVDGRAARIGGLLAAAAATAVVSALLVRAVAGAGVEVREDDVSILTPFVAIAGFGTFAGLLALGIAARQAHALPAGYDSLPWAMGVAAMPLLVVGGALEAVSERLLEVPVALLGLGWIALGVALWRAASAPHSARPTPLDTPSGGR